MWWRELSVAAEETQRVRVDELGFPRDDRRPVGVGDPPVDGERRSLGLASELDRRVDVRSHG